MHRLFKQTISVLLPVCALSLSCKSLFDSEAPPLQAQATIEDARAFYATKPDMLRPLPHADIPQGLANISAATCGACHNEIYEEWQSSTHAQAWLGDPQFQAELHKGDPTQSDLQWMCVNCHTPLENQLPRLVSALKDGALDQPIYVDNPNYDKSLQLEAITCATCHVKNGKIQGTISSPLAPHALEVSDTLATAATCTQCHQAVAHFEALNIGCFFNTGEEFAASDYSKEKKVCQSCHMPEVKRPITNLGTPERTSHRHFFGGSLIPKTPQAAAGVQKQSVHYLHGLETKWVNLPKEIDSNALPLSLELEYKNANAGHYLPTGDPERFLLIDVQILDEDGSILGQQSLEIGSKYEWWPKLKLLTDNRLKPGEQRQLLIPFSAPKGKQITATLTASKWRINEENLKYHKLDGLYIPGINFIEESVQIGVKL